MELFLQILIYVFVGIFGLCFGSFLNVVVYRLPNNMNLAFPSSHCTTCDYQLKWYDNIPVLSYLFLRGRCRKCHEKISPRYMIVELFTALLFELTYIRYVVKQEEPLYLLAILGVVFIMCLICLSFIDLEHYIIPNTFVIIIAVLGIGTTIYSIFNPFVSYNRLLTINWLDHLIGLFSGLAILVVVILVEKALKKEIMGGGDIKLMMATGLFLGWQLMLLGIFFGAVVALFVEIPLSFNKKLRQDHVLPFGPYLSLGFIISFLYGANIIGGYLGLFN